MYKKYSDISLYIFFIIIGLTYISVLDINFYPDNSIIFNNFIDMEKNSLQNSIQYLVFTNAQDFFELKIDKISFSLFFLVNVFFIIILITIQNLISNQSLNYLSNKLLLLSYCYPSVLISIVTPSAESVHVIISLFVITVLINKEFNFFKLIFIIILLFYGLFIDIGNSIVFLTFIFFILFMITINKYLNMYVSLLLTSVIFILLLSFGKEIILNISSILNWDVGNAIVNNIYINELNDVSLIEIFKRYIYFWLTLTGVMNHFKEFLFIILPLICIGIIIAYREIIKNWFKVKKYFFDPYTIIIIYLIIFFPFIIIFILPTHAFCKYYLFIIPILIKFLSEVLNQKNFLYFFPLMSVLFIINNSLI